MEKHIIPRRQISAQKCKSNKRFIIFLMEQGKTEEGRGFFRPRTG